MCKTVVKNNINKATLKWNQCFYPRGAAQFTPQIFGICKWENNLELSLPEATLYPKELFVKIPRKHVMPTELMSNRN